MPNEGKQERLPIVAICYDFDKTLSPDDMQAQGFIQSVGYDVAEFWKETGELARENNMDSNLSYMYKMVQEAEGNLDFSHAALEEYGSKVKLFDGVDGWFERLRQYGLEHGVKEDVFSCFANKFGGNFRTLIFPEKLSNMSILNGTRPSKKYIKRQPITEQRSATAMHRCSGAKTIRLLQSTTSPCLLCCRRFTASRQ